MSAADGVADERALTGRVAVVTGAASGIGLATSRALAARGAAVTMADVQDDAGARHAADAGAAYVHLDVSDADAWRALFGGFDRLDYLHLNAGIYDTDLADLTGIDDARYRRYVGVNVDGVFFGLREAIPLLSETRGSVVVTASMAGVTPLPANPLYALTKFALVGLVRSVAGELEERGVRINAVCPGAVATPLMGESPRQWFADRGIESLEPEAIATTVVGLLTGDATGQIVLHRAGSPTAPLEFPRIPMN